MAILNKIRERTVFLIVIIALALFAFVLADLFNNGGFSGNKASTPVGVIDGEEIGREEFSSNVEAIVSNGGGRLSSLQAAKQAWDNFMLRTVLNQEFDKLGLQVGPDQISNAMEEQLAGDPRFSTEDGYFDEAKMKQFIAELKMVSPEQYYQWINYENNVESGVKTDIYFNLIRGGIKASLLEGEQIYHQENDNLTFEFVKVPFDKADEVEISKSDIQSYINKHKERFQQEEKRDIEFISFNEEPSDEDNAEVLVEIEKLMSAEGENFKNTENVEEFVALNSEIPFNDFYTFEYNFTGEFAEDILSLDINEVYGPYFENGHHKLTKLLERTKVADSVNSSHILVTYEEARVDASVTRSKEDAKRLADSITNVLRRNGSKFSELAEAFSSDRQSAQDGGDLGWITYGSLVTEFNDYVFEKARVGSFGVVETDFGFHVISLKERTSPKDAVKLATIGKRVQPSEKTLNELFRTASKFELAAKQNDFREEAEAIDKKVSPVSGMNKLDETIPGAGRQRAIVQWAFEADTKVGDVKSFDIGSGYLVARVTKKTREGLKSPEEASGAVTPILKKQKQAEQIKTQMKGEDLDAIASSFGVNKQKATSINMSNPIFGGGRDAKVVGAAFAMEVGQVSKPIQGANGVYVIKVLEKKQAEPLQSYRGVAKEETDKRLRTIANPNTSIVVKALKDKAEVENNLHLIY